VGRKNGAHSAAFGEMAPAGTLLVKMADGAALIRPPLLRLFTKILEFFYFARFGTYRPSCVSESAIVSWMADL
jgi:hypothetical protein